MYKLLLLSSSQLQIAILRIFHLDASSLIKVTTVSLLFNQAKIEQALSIIFLLRVKPFLVFMELYFQIYSLFYANHSSQFYLTKISFLKAFIFIKIFVNAWEFSHVNGGALFLFLFNIFSKNILFSFIISSSAFLINAFVFQLKLDYQILQRKNYFYLEGSSQTNVLNLPSRYDKREQITNINQQSCPIHQISSSLKLSHVFDSFLNIQKDVSHKAFHEGQFLMPKCHFLLYTTLCFLKGIFKAPSYMEFHNDDFILTATPLETQQVQNQRFQFYHFLLEYFQISNRGELYFWTVIHPFQ